MLVDSEISQIGWLGVGNRTWKPTVDVSVPFLAIDSAMMNL